jgi:hypothetical protein
MRRRSTRWLVLLAALVSGIAVAEGRQGRPRFFSDDPISREPESQDASKAQARDIELAPDLLLNLFTRPGDPATGVRAGNVNTIDEVPDSSWFTNRIYARPVSSEEIKRGPNTSEAPAPGSWTVTSAKTSGISPGFTAKDSRGVRWFVQFDSARNPRAASGAVAAAVRLFWALGYNQVETHLITLRPGDLSIGEGAMVETRPGHRRPLRRRDLDDVLARAARNADGTYRGVAGLAVPGRVIGPFKYYGTRPDDPNDVVPHEHRRELRALKVFGAWTNLVDMKAGNTLDTVVEQQGKGVVRHYLQDVGSTFGTGALGPREWDEGAEYLYEGAALMKRLVSLGFFIKPWQTTPYRPLREVGRFEGDRFDPLAWRPRVPTAAFVRADDLDTFWAALRVAAFSDRLIRAAVSEARFEDASAERHLGDVLIKRRDAIARAYLRRVNPLTRFALSGDGRLTMADAAAEARAGTAAESYEGQWFEYDNATDRSTSLGSSKGATSLDAPKALPSSEGSIVKITIREIRAGSDAAPDVDVYFRRRAGQWQLIGVDRQLPEAKNAPPATH